MIDTRSVFYYGNVVEVTSNTLRINEGAADVDVTIPSGRYSLSRYIEVVSTAINSSLSDDYTVIVDRETRLVTIINDQANNFELKVADIFPLNSGFPILGFKTEVNLSGASQYTSDSASGKAYFPQMKLQKYIDFEIQKEYLNGTVKESADGVPEVVSFGLVEFMSCNIISITNREMIINSPMENNPTGYEDAVSFMDYLITKGGIEFIPDRDNRDSFTTCILESTPRSKSGIGYRLEENFKLLGFYETGTLTFRKTEGL